MRRLWPASAALALLEVAVAGYLTFEHARGDSPLCLAGGGGCATVADSPYARMAGVPVAALGLAGALAILALAAAPGQLARAGAGALALVGAAFSAYLTYLELFVIDAICQWCVASAVLWGCLCAIELWRWRAALSGPEAGTAG